jgi:hypothetical protein
MQAWAQLKHTPTHSTSAFSFTDSLLWWAWASGAAYVVATRSLAAVAFQVCDFMFPLDKPIEQPLLSVK